ncbi:MAG: AAA family ATPase, partial [Candidatus Helarchaeota archaeon]
MIIAIVGKGGVGKSMFTALFTRALIKDNKKKILLVDGDPAYPHLARILGVEADQDLEKIRKKIVKSAGKKDDETKHSLIGSLDYMLFESLQEHDNFSMLVMGQPELKGCFCPANTLLRESIEILAENFNYMIIDCEAGLEQINRKVIRMVNIIIIVSDPALRSLETAISIKETAGRFTRYDSIFL